MHLPWIEVYAEPLLMPEPTVELLNSIELDAVHAQSEEQVLWIAQNAQNLQMETLCPTAGVVLLSQDKFEACLEFRRTGLRSDRVHLVQDMIGLDDAINDLGLPVWVRARHGAGARGSALCSRRTEAVHWLQYWQARDPLMDFIAEEYLPGRDFAWTSLWYQGELVASFGRERLEYIYPNLAPSGRTGTPSIAVTVHNDALNTMAMHAVTAIDSEPNGFYSVDLREDAQGIPRPTEINAGRCFTTSYLSTAAGLNFMDLWCLMIEFGSPPRDVQQLNSIPSGLTWMRHIDCPELLLDTNGKALMYRGMQQKRRLTPKRSPMQMRERAALRRQLAGRGRDVRGEGSPGNRGRVEG
jgi:carbamoyl-phosphate synthase large subunit